MILYSEEISAAIPSDRKTCFVNVDSYEHRQIKGTVFNPYYKCSKPYESLTELLLLMENLFDEVMPRLEEGDKIRTFGKAKSPDLKWEEDPRLNPDSAGEIATFKIDVLFRQRASWQGVVCWMDANRDECFRSTLEMVKLIDSALSEEKIPSANPASSKQNLYQ